MDKIDTVVLNNPSPELVELISTLDLNIGTLVIDSGSPNDIYGKITTGTVDINISGNNSSAEEVVKAVEKIAGEGENIIPKESAHVRMMDEYEGYVGDPFEHLPDGYDWIAVDSDGLTFVYYKEPWVEDNTVEWKANTEDDKYLYTRDIEHTFDSDNWKESLIERIKRNK